MSCCTPHTVRRAARWVVVYVSGVPVHFLIISCICCVLSVTDQLSTTQPCITTLITNCTSLMSCGTQHTARRAVRWVLHHQLCFLVPVLHTSTIRHTIQPPSRRQGGSYELLHNLQREERRGGWWHVYNYIRGCCMQALALPLLDRGLFVTSLVIPLLLCPSAA
jgi:hypothetical protein